MMSTFGEAKSGRFPNLEQICDAVICTDDFSNDFKRTLIIRWLISAYAVVARKSEDSFRNRGVLVFFGRQSMGKTTFLRNLVGANWGGNKLWFGEGMTLDPDVKDSRISVISYWITELAELENTTKKEMSVLKAFLTNSEDSLRKPYAAEETSFTRRTVFAGTVNEKGFLTDPTGNTRFWVIPVKEFKMIDKIDMQQVWAEVKELYDNKVQWHLTQDEEERLNETNLEYVSEDSVESYIGTGLDWESDRSDWEYKTITEALIQCGMREPKKADCRTAARYIGKICDAKGGVDKKQVHGGIYKYKLPCKKKSEEEKSPPKPWETGWSAPSYDYGEREA